MPDVTDKGPCFVDGCGREEWARGLCGMHYGRWRRTGSIDLAPRAVRVCSVDGCERVHFCRGFCVMHHGRWAVHGEPETVAYTAGEEHPQWRGGRDAYQTAHVRVRKARGKAAAQTCEHCGGAARHWAYDHQDPAERICAKGGRPFSDDPGHYLALCSPCHWRLDHSTMSR